MTKTIVTNIPDINNNGLKFFWVKTLNPNNKEITNNDIKVKVKNPISIMFTASSLAVMLQKVIKKKAMKQIDKGIKNIK